MFARKPLPRILLIFLVLNLKQLYLKCAFFLLMNDTCLTTIVIVNIDCQVEGLNHHGNKPLGKALSPQTTEENAGRCTINVGSIILWASGVTVLE